MLRGRADDHLVRLFLNNGKDTHCVRQVTTLWLAYSVLAKPSLLSRYIRILPTKSDLRK